METRPAADLDLTTRPRSAPLTSPRRRIRALIRLCSVLRAGMPGAMAPVRSIAPTEWADLVALADEVFLAPTVWPAASRAKLEIPEPERGTLHRRHLWNMARNLAFRNGLEDAVRGLNDAGIEPLLFKGSLWLAHGVYGDAGERWMADLDVAVPRASLVVARRALESVGYQMADPENVRDNPYVRPDVPGVIELHVDVYTERRTRALPEELAWRDSRPFSFGSATALGLSPTHQVLQCIGHSAVQDRTYVFGTLPLRQLWTLSRLCSVQGDAVDWAAIEALGGDEKWAQILRTHLWLEQRAFGVTRKSERRDTRSALHGARVLANFAVKRAAKLQQELYYTFGRAALERKYGHAGKPLWLAALRARQFGRLVATTMRSASRRRRGDPV